jgi:hypothetical protein
MKLLTAVIAIVSLTLASGCDKKSGGSDTASSASAAPTAATAAAAPASSLPVKGPWEAIKITMTKKDPDGTAHFHIDNLGSKTVSSIFLDTYGYDAKGKQVAHKERSFSIPTKGGASADFSQDPVKDVGVDGLQACARAAREGRQVVTDPDPDRGRSARGRIAYRIKKVRDGRAKHHVMTPRESAAVQILRPETGGEGAKAQPRPRPGLRAEANPAGTKSAGDTTSATRPFHPEVPAPLRSADTAVDAQASGAGQLLTPNALSVKHWNRLLGGALYAASRRLDWASLLRRSFEVDALACPSCDGRLRVLGEVADAGDGQARARLARNANRCASRGSRPGPDGAAWRARGRVASPPAGRARWRVPLEVLK